MQRHNSPAPAQLLNLAVTAIVALSACQAESGSVDPAAVEANGKFDAAGCFAQANEDERRGVLALLALPSTTLQTLDEDAGLRADAARNLVAAAPLADWAEVDATPRVGDAACAALTRYACDVRGLCEPSIEFVTWNVEHFPLSGDTVHLVANTIVDLGADLVGFQEVDDPDAFDRLLDLLPSYHGFVGAEGFGTRVAILYRYPRFSVDNNRIDDLFESDSYAFPRPPLHVAFKIEGRAAEVSISVVVVHLKAMLDWRSQKRRRDAIEKLDEWISTDALPATVVLGDWNDKIDDAGSDDVFEALRSPDYELWTQSIAGSYSYIPFRGMIDHIIGTDDAEAMMPMVEAEAVGLEYTIDDYVDRVSDHRPVLTRHVPVIPATP